MLELNKVLLVGNLTRDPDIRYVPSGTAVADFDLAVNRSFRDRSGEQRRETLFIKVESWGRQAEFCSEYLKKGSRVYVEGRLKNETWEGRDGVKRQRTTVVADRIQFADVKPAEPPTEEAPETREVSEETSPDVKEGEKKESVNDDLPF